MRVDKNERASGENSTQSPPLFCDITRQKRESAADMGYTHAGGVI